MVKDISNKFKFLVEGTPNYIIKQPEFYCPISPYIMWHYGFRYKECPVNKGQRDMPSCSDCKLSGNETKIKDKKKKISRMKRKRELIPNIKKTYISK